MSGCAGVDMLPAMPVCQCKGLLLTGLSLAINPVCVLGFISVCNHIGRAQPVILVLNPNHLFLFDIYQVDGLLDSHK